MSKDAFNRAQRRRQARDARVHVPRFWDSMFNRVWVIALAAAVVGTIVYGAMPKSSQTATAPKPATPPATAPATPAAPAQPAAPASTPAAEVKTEDVKVGTGPEVKVGDSVTVHYTGTLTNGEKFDSSRDRGEPLTFTIGSTSIIPGWSQGIVGMKQGGQRKLTIPPSLGYGERGKGEIPPNATLLFDIEVVKIEPKS
jgi:FKBP-type peptidyl-prolyl cis-trans isomerase